MNVIKDEIRDAIEKELAGANEKFPLFGSMHEAIAVIAEERDEAADELLTFNNNMRSAWAHVKMNADTSFVLRIITRMKFAAEALAIEACQMSAMCEKAIQSAAEWKEGAPDDEN